MTESSARSITCMPMNNLPLPLSIQLFQPCGIWLLGEQWNLGQHVLIKVWIPVGEALGERSMDHEPMVAEQNKEDQVNDQCHLQQLLQPALPIDHTSRERLLVPQSNNDRDGIRGIQRVTNDELDDVDRLWHTGGQAQHHAIQEARCVDESPIAIGSGPASQEGERQHGIHRRQEQNVDPFHHLPKEGILDHDGINVATPGHEHLIRNDLQWPSQRLLLMLLCQLLNGQTEVRCQHIVVVDGGGAEDEHEIETDDEPVKGAFPDGGNTLWIQ